MRKTGTETAGAIGPTPDDSAVREALRGVVDPELGASIVDLGLVRTIGVQDGHVRIELVLPAPGCPLAGWLAGQVQAAVAALPGIGRVDVNLLDEPWTPADRLAELAHVALASPSTAPAACTVRARRVLQALSVLAARLLENGPVAPSAISDHGVTISVDIQPGARRRPASDIGGSW